MKKIVANEFNEFFTSMGESTILKVERLANKYGYNGDCNVENMVISLVKNKGPGYYKIPAEVIVQPAHDDVSTLYYGQKGCDVVLQTLFQPRSINVV